MQKKKSSSMKVRVPGSNRAVNKAKYEVANEFGLNLESNKQLNEQSLAKSKTNSRVNSTTKQNRKSQSRKCK